MFPRHLRQQVNLAQVLRREVEQRAPVRLLHHQDEISFAQQRRRQQPRAVPGQIHAAASKRGDRVRARAVAFFGPHAGRRHRETPPSRPSSAMRRRRMAAAMGDRQMLAVQATRITFNVMVLVVLPVEFLVQRAVI